MIIDGFVVIDLDVHSLCYRVEKLTEEVANIPPPDDISRDDWSALLGSASLLLGDVREKVESGQKDAR